MNNCDRKLMEVSRSIKERGDLAELTKSDARTDLLEVFRKEGFDF
jgi:hypothetical protein